MLKAGFLIKTIMVVMMVMTTSFMAIHAQAPEPFADDEPEETLMENIAGTWQSINSTRQGADTLQGQTLIFFVDARYERKSGETVTESGSYRVQETHGDLILEPDDQEPVSYTIHFSADGLKLTLTRERGDESQQTTYRRTDKR